MPSDNSVIAIVTFNNPTLLVNQLQAIRKMSDDPIVIIDNSNIEAAAEAIEYHSGGCEYLRLKTNLGASESHAFACNMAHFKLHDRYRYIMLLDHDIFPVKPFSVQGLLNGKAMAGLLQDKSKKYFWPGCFVWDNEKVEHPDFSVNHAHKLDTGGNLHLAIEMVGIENCVCFSEHYENNPYFQEPPYNFYSVINDQFIHFINSSNWRGVDNNEERVNSLLNVVKEKCGLP